MSGQTQLDEVTLLLNRLHREGGHGWIERAAERLTIHFDRAFAEVETLRAALEAVRAAQSIGTARVIATDALAAARDGDAT